MNNEINYRENTNEDIINIDGEISEQQHYAFNDINCLCGCGYYSDNNDDENNTETYYLCACGYCNENDDDDEDNIKTYLHGCSSCSGFYDNHDCDYSSLDKDNHDNPYEYCALDGIYCTNEKCLDCSLTILKTHDGKNVDRKHIFHITDEWYYCNCR